jgi:hypothetical protein
MVKIKIKKHELLTTGNPKILKGMKKGYLTALLHVSPSTMNDTHEDLCSFATPACRLGCLNTAGRGYFDKKVKKARRRKANQFVKNRKLFVSQLMQEIAYYNRQATRKDLIVCIRLNGTADINFYEILVNGLHIFDTFPDIQFYDYTKSPVIAWESLTQKNHHITFSHSGENGDTCDIVKSLFNIAVPFSLKKGEKLPEDFYGLEVIDGDINDLRFKDKKNKVVGLRVKGIKQAKQVNQFIIQIEGRRDAI